jgi:hypothetical protein
VKPAAGLTAIERVLQRSPIISFGTIILVYLVAVSLTWGLQREPWGDERHFLEQARSFGKDLSLDHLRDYEEVTPPLAFILYGLWGKVAGLDTANLRVLSLIIAGAVFVLLTWIAVLYLKDHVQALGVLCMFLINPYTIGLSVFVYTDMVMILFLLLFLLAMLRERALLVSVAVACGLLTRQYFVFAVMAGAGYLLWRWQYSRSEFARMGLVALVIGTLPLASMMALWKGIAPPTGTAIWITSAPGFHTSYVVLYVALSLVFVLPIVVLRPIVFRQGMSTHILLLFLSLLYFVSPVRSSMETVKQTGRETVGLFHRALVSLGGGTATNDLVFYVGWLGGLYLLTFLGRDTVRRVRTRRIDLSLLLNLLFLSFFLVMPFSYQVWEKYFLPVVPVLSLRLLKENRRTSVGEGSAQNGLGDPTAGHRASG